MKKESIANLKQDLQEIKDTFDFKRQCEIKDCQVRFNAYADKLSKEIKMDKDNW
jgi:hypothetical protein